MRHDRRNDPFQAGRGQVGDPRLRVRKRPTPWEWLWYAFGGGLDPRLSQWVLRDTTGPTWWLRHIVRTLLQLAPFIAAVIVFLPGPLDLRIYTAVLGLLCALVVGLSTMWGTTEHRLVKAGFAPDEAERARAERHRR